MEGSSSDALLVASPATLTGLPEAVYLRVVAAFARHAAAGGGAFLPDSALALEAAAREALGAELFSARRFAFFSRKVRARWTRIALPTFELLVAALFPGRSLEGLAYVGLVMTLLFPAARGATLAAAELDEMVRASAPDEMPADATDELTACLRRWAGAGDGADAVITREGYLRMTAEMESLTAALEAEEAAAEIGESLAVVALPREEAAAAAAAADAGAGATDNTDKAPPPAGGAAPRE